MEQELYIIIVVGVYVLWSLRIIFKQQTYINNNILPYEPDKIEDFIDKLEQPKIINEPSKVKLQKESIMKDYIFDSKLGRYVKVGSEDN